MELASFQPAVVFPQKIHEASYKCLRLRISGVSEHPMIHRLMEREPAGEDRTSKRKALG
jgi:hypothetical protein